eukprot:TRINITY_DN1808_c0_g1_i2.p2 TRINITY_DN1808_c0_g1~~TRINITY_DN1808_c0_g1_i2.p2  ORF type:complete len:121 (+),score=17.00 TRINITY_DN1808_c0_g1_i2:19-381(+)
MNSMHTSLLSVTSHSLSHTTTRRVSRRHTQSRPSYSYRRHHQPTTHTARTYHLSPLLKVQQQEWTEESVAQFYRERRTKNVLMFLALILFAGGAYAYTIYSVSQDDFSDVDDEGNVRVKI